MQRHITDQNRARDAAIRIREYRRLAAQSKPHSATSTLQKRPHTTREGRLLRFVKIARQQVN